MLIFVIYDQIWRIFSIFVKKYANFHHLDSRKKIIGKYADFGHKSGKLVVQIEEENCANENNTEMWKIYEIFEQVDEKCHQQNLARYCPHFNFFLPLFIIWPAVHLLRYTRKRLQNAKNEKCMARYFASLFSHFAPIFSLLAFRSILLQSCHSCEKSKEFVVYFFVALIKHKICVKYEKCKASVSYFVVRFAKTFTKYPQNAKYKKCIASPWRVKSCLYNSYYLINL